MRANQSGRAWGTPTLVLAGLVAATQTNAADIPLSPVSQARSINIRSEWNPNYFNHPPPTTLVDSAAASDFTLFQATRSLSIVDGIEHARSSATQDSQIGSYSIRGTGSGASRAEGDSGGAAAAEGNSRFALTFDLLEPTTWTIQGTLTYSDHFGNFNNIARSFVSLSGPGGSGYFLQIPSGTLGTSVTFSSGGAFSAGRYTLSASALTSGNDFAVASNPGPDLASSYNFAFNIPEPALTPVLAGTALLLTGGKRRRRASERGDTCSPRG